jgi:hypothetical protein
MSAASARTSAASAAATDTVATCAMLECSFSKPAKEKIAKLQAAGLTDKTIIDQFVAEFGPAVYRGDPSAYGWLVPYLRSRPVWRSSGGSCGATASPAPSPKSDRRRTIPSWQVSRADRKGFGAPGINDYRHSSADRRRGDRLHPDGAGQGPARTRAGFPFQHLDERKAAIYENLRDLQFEYRVGKLSDHDYQQTKKDLQRELAGVMAEVDRLKLQLSPNGAAAVHRPPKPHRPANLPALRSKSSPSR